MTSKFYLSWILGFPNFRVEAPTTIAHWRTILFFSSIVLVSTWSGVQHCCHQLIVFIVLPPQARAHLHAPGELPLGLHLVNSTNLDYFQPQHQAELFRLKGQFLQALGERDQANSNYSTALTNWVQLPEGWLSWGSHCDEMYESSGNHAWLEYAVSCYLQAVKHGSCAGRTMLPRVLHLLSFENNTGAVGRALDRKLNEVRQLPLHCLYM